MRPHADRFSHNGLNGPSKYPSITTHRGALPESWFPKWLLRRLQRRHPKPVCPLGVYRRPDGVQQVAPITALGP